jgi:methionine synthase I (cobalamin-dependent)
MRSGASSSKQLKRFGALCAVRLNHCAAIVAGLEQVEEAKAMSKYRSCLPQLSGGLFLTDGGIETTLIFHDGLDLPHFAAFHGCCGTDHRHLEQISQACRAAA